MADFALLPRSLRFRMAGVVVMLVLIATIVVTWVSLLLAERDMKSVIGNQQYALLSSAAAQVDAQMSAKKVLLASLADTMPAEAGLDVAHMKAFVDRHPVVRKAFLNLHIYNQRGALLNTTGEQAAALQLNPRVTAYLDRALAAGKPTVSPPFKSVLTGLPVIIILQPVLDSGGRAVMLLGGTIDLTNSSLLEQVAAQKPGETGFSFIMTKRGILVHHPDAKRLLKHINDRPGHNGATEMALNGFEGWTEAANKDGSEGIYSYKHLASTDWILASRFPVDEAFAPMIALRHHAILASAAFAAVAGLLAWIAIQVLLKPLGRLRRNISDIRNGAADIGVLQRRRRDEIGELGSAFHELMAERESAQQAIRDNESLVAASEKRLKLLTDNLPVLISYLDQERKFQFLNATYQHWFGRDPSTLLGRHLMDGIGHENYHTAEPHLDKAYRGQIATYELKTPMNGGMHTLETTFIPELTPDGRVAGIYSLTHDTTRLKEIEERLTQLARVDALTGIANRLMFEEMLVLAIVRAKRNRKPLALAYLDVDRFKEINDTLGHGAGDIVLKEFASRLLANVRAADTVARLAGDEFIIIFEQVVNIDEARRLAAKIVEAMRVPFEVEGSLRKITTSIGVALHDGDQESMSELVARADSALYAAKRNGRDGYAIAD